MQYPCDTANSSKEIPHLTLLVMTLQCHKTNNDFGCVSQSREYCKCILIGISIELNKQMETICCSL